MPKNIKPIKNNDNKITAIRNKRKDMIIKLNKIKKVFEEAKIYYEDNYDLEISVDKLGDETVKTVIQKGKRNVLLE